MLTKKVWCNRLVIRDGKLVIFDIFGNRYTKFNGQSSPSKTDVVVSENQIIEPKKKKKKRFFGR